MNDKALKEIIRAELNEVINSLSISVSTEKVPFSNTTRIFIKLLVGTKVISTDHIDIDSPRDIISLLL